MRFIGRFGIASIVCKGRKLSLVDNQNQNINKTKKEEGGEIATFWMDDDDKMKPFLQTADG